MTKHNTSIQDITPDELISTIAEAIVPVTPPKVRASALKSRVMARIQSKKIFNFFTVKSEEGEWITLLPGVEKKILNEDHKNQIQSYLLKIAPGASIPEHLHPGDEEGFMIEGEVSFGDIHLSAGDYLFAPKGTTHAKATTKTGCMVLIHAYEAFN